MRLFRLIPATPLLVLLPALATQAALCTADPDDRAPEVVSFSDVDSGTLAEPVTLLQSFLDPTLKPHPITIRVRQLNAESLVHGAPVLFEVMSPAGTISTSTAASAATLLSATTDATGAAMLYFHPAPPFDIPGSVRVTVEGGEPLTFLFFPDPFSGTQSGTPLTGGVNAIGGALPGTADQPGGAGIQDPSGSDSSPAYSLDALVAYFIRPHDPAAVAVFNPAERASALRAFLRRSLVVFTPLE